jgi:WD40 repeat protein
MLASSSDDQTIRLWQKDDQQGWSSRDFQGHANRIRCVAFSPDGRFLVSCSDDGSIRFWNWQSGQSTQTLINERPYEQMNISGVRGLAEAQKTALRALGAFDDASG